ncbi:MAG: hypothetical protein LBD20_01685 [Spirochaetaceae bacterium]|jgi:hypothetical protein|nr:hypothetical protein [Spirochaetaceae bacterium]
MKALRIFVPAALCFFLGYPLAAQDILRGEARVDVEPAYMAWLGQSLPADDDALYGWALEETALSFSAMIYGWNFDYEPGDRVRGLAENLNLQAQGSIQTNDPRLAVDSAKRDGHDFSMWADYKLDTTQRHRITSWNAAGSMEIQAGGRGALTGSAGNTERVRVKAAALEDAARAAIRARLKTVELNRPRRVRGKIALAAFPICGIENGQWAVKARFRLIVENVEHYVLY